MKIIIEEARITFPDVRETLKNIMSNGIYITTIENDNKVKLNNDILSNYNKDLRHQTNNKKDVTAVYNSEGILLISRK